MQYTLEKADRLPRAAETSETGGIAVRTGRRCVAATLIGAHKGTGLDVIKAAMAELLASGGKRPTCVVWQGR